MFLAVVHVKICTAKHYIICNVDNFFLKNHLYIVKVKLVNVVRGFSPSCSAEYCILKCFLPGIYKAIVLDGVRPN